MFFFYFIHVFSRFFMQHNDLERILGKDVSFYSMHDCLVI